MDDNGKVVTCLALQSYDGAELYRGTADLRLTVLAAPATGPLLAVGGIIGIVLAVLLILLCCCCGIFFLLGDYCCHGAPAAVLAVLCPCLAIGGGGGKGRRE